MTVPRRAILRPPRSNGAEEAQRTRRRQRLRADIERATAALTRWQSRFRRAFNSVEKLQRQLSRLTKQIRQLDA